MREINRLQIVTSGLHRTAGPYKVHGQTARTAQRGMANLLAQSRAGHCRYGYVRRADTLISSDLRLFDCGAWSTADFMFGVTAHPTAEWIANQITEACGWEQAPRYLIRDRDGAYGEVFIRRLRSMGIRDRPTSPRSPWENGYAERLIGSIRRECLDHVVVFSERHLRHLLLSYMKYYNGARTHLSLEKDAPVSRAVDRAGHILCRPILGGLHHQYARI
jgi:transposase InsO family protein